MSLSLCAQPRDTAPQRSASTIRRAGGTTATVAAAALVALTYSWVEGVPVGVPFSPAVVVAAIAVLAGLVMLVRGRAEQVRRRRRATDECLDWIEQLSAPGSLELLPGPSAVPSAPSDDDTSARPEAPHVRALRMQVRALEHALEEQVTALAQARHELEQREPEQEPGRDLDRVLVTMGALRDQLHGDAGAEHVLDRVQAAVTRLGSSRVPGRPALPAPSTRGPAPAPIDAAPATMAAPTAITPATVAPAPATIAAATTLTLPEATTPPGSAPETPVGAVAPEVESSPPSPVDVQPVLPVPAPATQPVSRGKSWRRRRVA